MYRCQPTKRQSGQGLADGPTTRSDVLADAGVIECTARVALVVALLAIPSRGYAWCRMTTSLRMPTAEEPCVLPDPTTDPPEQFLAWLAPCTAMTLSVTAPAASLSEAEVRSVLERTFATWDGVSCDGRPVDFDLALSVDENTCVSPLYRDGGGNTNAVMFVTDWSDRMYDPAAFAITTVWHRRTTGEILDVDMELNEERGPYAICPEPGCTDGRVDLENVVAHEMGHYLGLAHSEVELATMAGSAVAGETSKRDLHDDDMAGICAVYPPGAFGESCDATPRGGLGLDCEPGCGCAVPGLVDDSRGVVFLLLALLWIRRRTGGC